MSTKSRRRKLPAEAVTLDIKSLNPNGRGVAQIDGKPVHVNGALAGERVIANYVRRRGKIAELAVQEVLQASPHRIEPDCEYAGTCGGCSLRHLDTDAQLAFKESILLQHLQHTTGINSDSLTILPRIHGDTRHYRRKARLAVKLVRKKGGALVGFREKFSPFITDMHYCQVLDKEVARLIAPLRELITNLDGADQIPQIEVAVGETSTDLNQPGKVALVLRHLSPLTDGDQTRLLDFANNHQIELYLQAAGPDSVLKLYPDTAERLSYYLPEFALQMQFHPQDFTQVNASINRQLIPRALQQLDLQQTDRVLDLFCGLGNFTLPLAQHCTKVIGVEGSGEMVKRAAENASLNGIANAEFHCADLSKPITPLSEQNTALSEQDTALSEQDTAPSDLATSLSEPVITPWAQQKFDKILLDPPRSGAMEILPAMVACEPQRIVYVSCNPATLARDAALLIQSGYELKSAGVMDMFPHTTHVESMAVFHQRN